MKLLFSEFKDYRLGPTNWLVQDDNIFNLPNCNIENCYMEITDPKQLRCTYMYKIKLFEGNST